jgi:cysteinyl-tRNA synthetase
LLQQDTGAWLKGRGISDAKVTDGVTITPLPATAGASAGGAGVLIQTPEARVEELVSKRVIARAAKDFTTSDRIRDELAAQGIVLEDKPDGTTEWRRA